MKKGPWPPPTQLHFAQYYLLFITFYHTKYKILQAGPLNFHLKSFGPSYNVGQGPPLSTTGSELLCFLDAYSGYHQIRLKKEDELKTSFITPFGAFCYKTMPFGLKNAEATYQWCIQNCFKEQIGRNVHAYVDDVVSNLRKQTP